MSAVKIPREWEKISLGAVLELKYGKSLPAKKRDNGKYPVYGSNGIVGKHSQALVESAGVVIGRKGSFGEVQLSLESFFPIDTTYFVDDFFRQPIKYWFYQLKQLPLTELNRSTAIPGLNREDAYAQEIFLPPLAEQKVIADKLDTLLAQVDATKARLERIPQLLKRFRQSVLADAVSGKLTETQKSAEMKISEFSKVIGGLTKNSKRSTFEMQKKYLRVANVYENELKLDDVLEIGVAEKELGRALLEKYDILVVEGNGSIDQIGRVAMWRGEIPDCVHQNHLIKIRSDDGKVMPEFLLFYLMSPQGKSEVVKRATSGAGLYTLSISKISSICVPIYSIEEQAEIVSRVKKLFAHADKIEQQVQAAKARVDQLTQSILAKAFRGELTAEWRAQNPELISGEHSAEALLAKIQAEREAMKPKKKTRARKVKA